MEEKIIFNDLPDEEKIKFLLNDNTKLRNKLMAEEMENRSLIDEVDRLNAKVSLFRASHENLARIKSKLMNYKKLFDIAPKKAGNNAQLMRVYLNEKGLYQGFVGWYSNKQSKFKQDAGIN